MPSSIDAPWSSEAQWKMAFVYAFISSFSNMEGYANLYGFPQISPADLEISLKQSESDILDQLLCTFLNNALNRKKPVDSLSYPRVLAELIESKRRIYEFDLDYNPMTIQYGFHQQSPDIKLTILLSLVEWQLQDSNNIRNIIELNQKQTKKGTNPLMVHPFGLDRSGRRYWQFGDYPWMWREVNNRWEVACRNVDELQQLSDSLNPKRNKAEAQLSHHIANDLIPRVMAQQRKQDKQDRAKARQLALEEMVLEPRKLRPRSERKSLRYTDFDESLDAYLSEVDAEDEAEPVRPTRVSRRLNPSQVEDDDVPMEEDTTIPNPISIPYHDVTVVIENHNNNVPVPVTMPTAEQLDPDPEYYYS